MRRVIFALLGEALAIAALVIWFELGHAARGRGLGALGVFAGVLFIGFACLYYCCKRRQWDAWRFMVVGASGGALCALPLYGNTGVFVFLMLAFALAGFVFGLLFWFSAVWRNRELTCPTTVCLPCGTVYRAAPNALNRQSK